MPSMAQVKQFGKDAAYQGAIILALYVAAQGALYIKDKYLGKVIGA